MSERQVYSRERLAEAARVCGDIREVIDFLGTRPYDKLERYLFRRFERFGIDVSHLGCSSSRRRARPAKEKLRDAVASSRSIARVLSELGLPDTASRRAHLRRWVREDDLDTSHLLGQAHQRGGPGTVRRTPPAEILVRREDGRRTKTPMLRRAMREIGRLEQCAECGIGSTWLGDPITLEIDHVNGDWLDNRQENLRFLCPNCHAITGTWCRGGPRRKPG